MFKKLNNGKISEDLIFLGGNGGGNELRFHVILNIGMLNKSNEHFLDYLLSDFASKVLSKIEMIDSGNIYYNNLSMRESIYRFIYAQQDETNLV